jgi:hypothetical protein
VHIYLRHILLADLFEQQSKFLVRIAALGKKTSLNVAPAAGFVLCELVHGYHISDDEHARRIRYFTRFLQAEMIQASSI